MIQVSPSVLQLAVHLPGYHMVAYNSKEDLRDVTKREKSEKSILTEYFRMNSIDPKSKQLLYREFPESYRWDKSNTTWLPRQKWKKTRLVYATAANGERFYLKVLLHHVRVPLHSPI